MNSVLTHGLYNSMLLTATLKVTPFLFVSISTGLFICNFRDVSHIHELSLTCVYKYIGLCNDTHQVQFLVDGVAIPLFLVIDKQYYFNILKHIFENACIENEIRGGLFLPDLDSTWHKHRVTTL